MEQSESLFDDVAEFAEVLDVGGALAGDDRENPALAQFAAVGVGVVALVAEQGYGTPAGTAGAACRRWDAVDQGEGLGDVVDVGRGGDDLERRSRRNAAGPVGGRIVFWMFWQARCKHEVERPYDERDDSWQRIGVGGLPGELTWEEFTAASSGSRRSIGNTRPLELMTRSGGSLLLPRAYAEWLCSREPTAPGHEIGQHSKHCRNRTVHGFGQRGPLLLSMSIAPPELGCCDGH